MAMTLAEVARAVGGTLHDADPGAVVAGSVEYDSRKVVPGALFLALPGEHADGHDFAATALGRGAVAVLCTRPVDGPRIEVADGIAAITALASVAARRLPATIIGITGSAGKTSTKDMLGQVLASVAPTVAPAGSLNNELGHPYTVLRAGAETRYLVLEMGARGVGHIRHLAGIAPPRIGAVLNVGSAHLGEFGSREAIAQAKGELVEALPADGHAVLNADDPLVAAMRARTAAQVITFGTAPHADVRAERIGVDELDRPHFELRAGTASAPVRLRYVGAHQVGNALAAAAMALAAGLRLETVAAALSRALPASRWRMEVTERPDGVVVVNDAYNANPESMRAALASLAALGRARGARTLAVLGEMAELGAAAQAEHEAIGRLVADLAIARLVVVGDAARPMARAAALEGSGTGGVAWVPDIAAAIEAVNAELRAGDVVLVKASRAASLERVALAITEDAVAGPERGGDAA